jgi:hypothetical protein
MISSATIEEINSRCNDKKAGRGSAQEHSILAEK